MTSTGTWKGPFGYSGEHGYQEDATGLQLLGHRYYDPSTGRFLTRDPAKDGRNWYGYCDNDRLRRADPSGMVALAAPAIVAGGVAGAVVVVVGVAAALLLLMVAIEWVTTHPIVFNESGDKDKDKGFGDNIKSDKDKSIEKGITSREDRIKEHKDKIENDPCSRDRDHWEKEIKTFERQNWIARQELLRRK